MTQVVASEDGSQGGERRERPFPVPREGTAPFWEGGAVGELRIQQCQSCRRLVHPPAILCPYDHERNLTWTVVSGDGRVESWTESQHAWVAGLPAPYLIALVALEEDAGARLITNLVGIESDDVTIGMPVHVQFLELSSEEELVYLPLFGPLEDGVVK